MDPIDIWRSAKVMVDKHGDQAPLWCRERAEAQKETGGEIVWEAIALAAESLIENGPPNDVPGPPA